MDYRQMAWVAYTTTACRPESALIVPGPGSLTPRGGWGEGRGFTRHFLSATELVCLLAEATPYAWALLIANGLFTSRICFKGLVTVWVFIVISLT